eukprot:Ihof_evm4s380 gene=Ihof_evmTU4s380
MLKNRPWYQNWLFQKGVQIQLGYIGWHTTAVGSRLQRCGIHFGRNRQLWKMWFNIGRIYGLIAMAVSFLILLANAKIQISSWLPILSSFSRDLSNPIIRTNITKDSMITSHINEPILTPIIPGINVPSSHLVYFFIALILNGFIHEMGHALAATCERIPITGFGVFICGIYPGAYVELDTFELQRASAKKQLRIYSAGVFHNLLLFVLSLLLFGALPLVLSVGYHTGQGAVIVDIPKTSSFQGYVSLGTRIVGVNSGMCLVQSSKDWIGCVNDLVDPKEDSLTIQPTKSHTSEGLSDNQQLEGGLGSIGYCMTVKRIANHTTRGIEKTEATSTNLTWWLDDAGVVECCQPEQKMTSPAHLCFGYSITTRKMVIKYACLPAHHTADNIRCEMNYECTTFDVQDTSANVCVFPVLPVNTTLAKVQLHGSQVPFLLFWGNPRLLYSEVSVSNYVPRSSFLPLTLPISLEIAL